MENLTLNQELLEQIGATDQADLVAKLQLAVSKGKSLESITELTTKIAENTETVTKALTAIAEQKAQDIEAEKFQEAVNEKAFEIFQGLPEDHPEKAKMREHYEKMLGTTDAAVLLEGDEFVKALQAPIAHSNPLFEERRMLRKAFDYLMILTAAKDGLAASKFDKERLSIDTRTLKGCFDLLQKQGFEGMDMLQKAVDQALDSETATEGLEWVPSQILSRNLYQDIWLSLHVAGQFSRFPTSGPNFSVPIRTGRSRMYGMDQAKAVSDYFTNKATAHNLNTDTVDFTIRKAAILNMISDELVDDAVIPMVEQIYEDLRWASTDGIEDAVINGSRAVNDLDNAGADTARLWANTADQGDGIRLDTGVVDARYLWNGIRKQVNSGCTVTSASFGRAELLALRSTMVKYGVNPNDVFIVVSPQTYIKMLGFEEVSTLDKYGSGATVIRGELAKIDGIPVLVSPHIYTNLDNKGYFTNGTVVGGSAGDDDKTIVLLVHRRGYAFADRMSLKIESDRMMLSGQRAVLGTLRMDFKKMFPAAEQLEAQLVNVEV